LRKTCGLYGILPASYTITYLLSKPGPRAFASGGSSDIWKLTDKRNPNMSFAVKSLRVYGKDPIEEMNKKYCKEVIVCKRAKHPNVLSIEGVVHRGIFEFGMVFQWMDNGDLLSYVTKHPEVNRLDMLVGVTLGLEYLHGNEVVHGDLKSSNILVDETGSPRLSDFGLSSITRNIDSANASTPNHGCTLRYCAPELLGTDGVIMAKKKPTTKSDVYSLSMVIVELTTGKPPFHGVTDLNVAITVSKGTRPQKPHYFDAPGITSGVWEVAKRCWHKRPRERPEVRDVLQELNQIAR